MTDNRNRKETVAAYDVLNTYDNCFSCSIFLVFFLY